MNKMKTKRSRLHGGVVYEGSEGCVFVPELKSTGTLFSRAKYNTRSGKFITKIYRRAEDLKSELRGIALMKQVDPAQEYTKTFIDTTAKPDIASIDVSEKCSKPLSPNSPALYMYYNGVSLQALRKRGTLNEVLKPVLAGLSRLSILFVNMAKNNVIHGDIQPGNLLYNKDDGNVYLIDFTSMQVLPGLTDKTSDIKSLAIVISDILIAYKKSQLIGSTCETVVSQILNDIYPKIKASKDVEVIHTMIVNSIDIILKNCFSGNGRSNKRRTLRRKVHRNMH